MVTRCHASNTLTIKSAATHHEMHKEDEKDVRTCGQDARDFTLTLANVEWISEEDTFMGLRCCNDITILGPLALDGDPLKFSQCEITGSDGATWLELRVMPGCVSLVCLSVDPNAGGSMLYLLTIAPKAKFISQRHDWVRY